MSLFLLLFFSAPALPAQVSLRAGEARVFLSPCDGQVSAPDGVEVSRRGETRVRIAAWKAAAGEVRFACGAVQVRVEPSVADALPELPPTFLLRAGEDRAFRKPCELRGESGKGGGARFDVAIRSVMFVRAAEAGWVEATFSCADGTTRSARVDVLP